MGKDGQAIDGDVGFKRVSYFANKPMFSRNKALPTLEMAANPQQGVIISAYSYSVHDFNDYEDKAYSSTLCWNAWLKIAGMLLMAMQLVSTATILRAVDDPLSRSGSTKVANANAARYRESRDCECDGKYAVKQLCVA